jgi:radical SAM protein with 4Fe4S-binding SPASM domain
VRFKKIYLEITNNCNLSCDFCIKNDRKNKIMSFDEFKIIINKISNYTNYLYFHVLGEPLIHPNINEFINYAKDNNINVNITSNGYLIDKIKTKNIRQLNISLHSYNEKYLVSLDDYINKIFKKTDEIKENTYISYRIWLKSKNTYKIINKLNEKYNTNLTIDILEKKTNIKLDENIFLSISKEFIWPDLSNNYYNEKGNCYALKDHIGILVDGTIIPCCLDSKGVIKLGNIFTDDLEDIINSKRFNSMLKCFKDNKKTEELCKHCKFM